MTQFDIAIGLAATALLVLAAVQDVRTWRIPNSVTLALVALYAAGTAGKAALDSDFRAELLSWPNLTGDLAAAGLLLVIGILFWTFRMVGAGDAKLFVPIGLFIGWIGLLPFAILLALLGLMVFGLMLVPLPNLLRQGALGRKLDEIRVTRKVPYGIVMVPAALATMALRAYAGL